jgi:hypothetical protein
LVNAKARLEAATKVYEDLWKRAEADPARYPLDFDNLCTWSARWMEAQRDAADDTDARGPRRSRASIACSQCPAP